MKVGVDGGVKGVIELQENWGLLGPDRLPVRRRVRGLRPGSVVRYFNEQAVPGLGGIWFGKQVLLAMLGVVVAEKAREQGANVRNIEVANAIEALACWLSFDGNGWKQDRRLRGRIKLQGVESDLPFSRARQRGFYVTQPMRMSAVQTLPALGLTNDSARFNAFEPSEDGRRFVELACEKSKPFNKSVVDHLAKWVNPGGETIAVNTPALKNALSPLKELPPEAIRILCDRLKRNERRCAALAWVEKMGVSRAQPSGNWESRPEEITDEQHWSDLKAGARFLAVRDAAIDVLNAVESSMGNTADKQQFCLDERVSVAVVEPLINELRLKASEYLELGHEQEEASKFCKECNKGSDCHVIESLVDRDEVVLRRQGRLILPGAAFTGSIKTSADDADEDNGPDQSSLALPPNISSRVGNLYLLNLDLQGLLGGWLEKQKQAAPT